MDTVVLVFILLLLSVFALFSAEKALVRFYLMFQVRRQWFPLGRFVFFCYPEDTGWRGCIEEAIIPLFEDSAVVSICMDDPVVPRMRAPMTDRIMQTFGEGVRCPFALVFKPYFGYEVIDFYDAFKDLDKGDGYLLKKRREQLMSIVEDLRERMYIYI